jgi:thiamine-monophosphate kinase
VADDDSELAFIDWLRGLAGRHPCVPLGIGDDAALIRISGAGDCLVTVDMLMEGVDFLLPDTDARDIGRKALAVSLSDIAAMAGRPVAAVISVVFSRQSGREFAERLYCGIKSLAQEFNVAIAGGDTNSWDGPFAISVTVLGQPTGAGPVRRSGAQPGDWVMVTGELGGSLRGKHLSFTPRVREALVLRQSVDIHAMIDVSDGLAADLHHVLDESAVGAVVRAGALPISDAAHHLPGPQSALDHALGDGEDFELLFTVAPDDGQSLLKSPPFELRLSHIGEITHDRTCVLVDDAGHQSPLPPLGWVHRL